MKDKIKLFPNTPAGKGSVILNVMFIILAIIKYWPPPLVYVVYVVSFGGLILGFVAFLKKDKGILIFLPIIMGLICVAWTLVDIIFPGYLS